MEKSNNSKKIKLYPNEICNLGDQIPFQIEYPKFKVNIKDSISLDSIMIKIKNHNKLNT